MLLFPISGPSRKSFLPEQNLAVGAVEDVAVSGNEAAEVLEPLPVAVDVEFVGMAPDVVDLFNDPEVSKDIEEVLQNARDNNYRKTFTLLKSL